MKTTPEAITFTTNEPSDDILEAFESVYENELVLKLEDKKQVIRGRTCSWMLVGGEYAGEIYTELCSHAEKVIPDIHTKEYENERNLYLSSFAILPKFQGRGLGKVMLAFFIGRLQSGHFTRLVYHATSEGMNRLSDSFGFTTGAVHENWFGSGRTGVFRTLQL